MGEVGAVGVISGAVGVGVGAAAVTGAGLGLGWAAAAAAAAAGRHTTQHPTQTAESDTGDSDDQRSSVKEHGSVTQRTQRGGVDREHFDSIRRLVEEFA